jgi:muramoyltetrapeptide carboxypeptidase
MPPATVLNRAPALRPGDRVRLVAPASPFDTKRFERGVEAIRRLGLVPVVGREEFAATGFLAGDDAARAGRLVRAFAEEETRAVWAIRGGYGTARLLSHLDLDAIRRRPKLFIGFSDLTALLNQLSAPGGFSVIHGPVVTQLGDLPASALDWLRRLLFDPSPPGTMPWGRLKTVVPGKTNGFLAGGNLSILASLCGTPYFPELSGSILFLEDTGEAAYRLDRCFFQLCQSGALKNVFGVVLGRLDGCTPATGRFGARATLERAIAALGVPAVSGASFGHHRRNFALPLGLLARLDAGRGELCLLEGAAG